MSALRELLVLFSIDVKAEELDKAHKKVNGFVDYLRTVGPVLAEAFAIRALTDFVGETIEAGAKIVDLSNRLGIGTQELQQWQFAARTAGIEAETAAHSLGFLNRSIGEAVLGGKEQEAAFQKLGVSLETLKSGDTNAVLSQVADGFAKLKTQPERAAYAMKLFGREGQQLLPILSQGSEGLDKLREEFQELGGGMSKEFVQNAKKVDDALAGIKVGMQSLKSRIVGAMLPAITAFTNAAKRWVKVSADWLDHTNLLTHGLKLLAIASGIKLTSTLIKLAQVFGILKPSILGSISALLGFAIPIALIGIFVLLIEDLWTAIEGGDSVIGDMLEDLGGVEGKDAFVKELTDAWDELKAVWQDFDGWDPMEAAAVTIKFLVGAMYELVSASKAVFHALKGAGNVLGDVVSGVVGNESDAKYARQQIGKDTGDAGHAIAGDLDAMWNPGSHWRNHPAATTVPHGPGYDPALDPKGGRSGPGEATVGAITYGAPTVAPAAGKTVNQSTTVNVTVPPGKDAKATGRDVGASAAAELEKQNYRTQQALESM